MEIVKAKVHYQLPRKKLAQQAIERNEGALNDTGALVIATGEFTGRSPADKFIAEDDVTRNTVDWNKFNHAISETHFHLLKSALLAYLHDREEVWIRDAYACASPAYRLSLRIINEQPSANLFAANMFIAPEGTPSKPEWLILQAPGFKADPLIHGTRQGNFTAISFTDKTILIGGTAYTGEIKKGIFTVLNFLLPQKGILSMHCSANERANGDTALFFGLSGTGKTTLSSDPDRKLIGDDEHGWDESGIFNCEGGCYAKVINLSEKEEPQIYQAIRPGALVENTRFTGDSNIIDYTDKTITENTRVSYPLNHISNAKIPSVSGVPNNLFFLSCDAYGVFPPISKLSSEQAMYYFINGYTARIAGTEEGIREPQVAFSACFGAPFLPLHPATYAKLLQQKLEQHHTNVWLVNTGWTGGPYGTGSRIKLACTRAMITAALNGDLKRVPYITHPVFKVSVPQSCPGVPSSLLNPQETWASKEAYWRTASKLAGLFQQNYELIKQV